MESKNVCSICHATSVEIAYRFDSYNILRCKVCGTAYRETIHEETASQERYDEQKWLASRELFKDIYADEAKWRYGQLEIFQPGGRLLEIGFGTGEFLERASEAGHKVWGLDLSARAVAYINRSRPDINAQNCTLAEAGFPDDFFDVVVMLHVLEHMENPQVILDEALRILKHGGLIYVRVPNIDSLYRKCMGKYWWGFNPEHCWHYSLEGLRILLDNAGFSILHLESSGYEKYTCWGVVPFIYLRNRLKKSPKISNKSSSHKKPSFQSSTKRKIKYYLHYPYLKYRRACSLALTPLTFMLDKTNANVGGEICVIARKK